jgi:hypothetical protein
MRFTESNLFGIYAAPKSLLMVAAWIVTIALCWTANRFRLLLSLTSGSERWS